MTIQRLRSACWMTKSTDTHSEYVILIAFPQQWLRERASLLRYKYLACLVRFLITDEVTSISSPCFINSKLIFLTKKKKNKNKKKSVVTVRHELKPIVPRDLEPKNYSAYCMRRLKFQ